MTRLVVAIVLAAGAAAVAAVVRRRREQAPPSQPRTGYTAPAQLDRADFGRPDAPWLVALFTSSTCDSCRAAIDKATVLTARDVVVEVVDATEHKRLHDRYAIEAVPIVCVADAAGVVVHSFVGPVTATDLWAAVARARDPELPDPHCEHH